MIIKKLQLRGTSNHALNEVKGFQENQIERKNVGEITLCQTKTKLTDLCWTEPVQGCKSTQKSQAASKILLFQKNSIKMAVYNSDTKEIPKRERT